MNDIKSDKFDETINLMQQIQDSNPHQISQTYHYLFEDNIEKAETKDEISRDFKNGKFDPMGHAYRPHNKRNKVI